VVVSAGGAVDRIPVRTYAQGGRIDRFVYHAGDSSGVLEGARLDQVAQVTVAGTVFRPATLTSIGTADRLELAAAAPPEAAPHVGARLAVRVLTKDGRTERLEAVVQPPRPQVVVTALTRRAGPAPDGVPLALADKDEVAGGDVLVFTLAPAGQTTLQPHETVEVSTLDGAYATRLGPSNVVLADPRAAVVTLDTAKALDPSAYGPLRVRIVDDRGESDWQPLATLVRLPRIDAVDCTRDRTMCRLRGQSLFLIAALSADAKFANPVSVPAGFPGDALEVPRPKNGLLYLKLHDDPDVVSVVRLAAR
jgi:hypothetical protein